MCIHVNRVDKQISYAQISRHQTYINVHTYVTRPYTYTHIGHNSLQFFAGPNLAPQGIHVPSQCARLDVDRGKVPHEQGGFAPGTC